MNILGRLALLFIVVPVLELAVLIRVGQWIGVWPTVALVFLTGVTGAVLARAEGLRTLRTFRNELASGSIPGRAILDGVSILVGGTLLLTPGFVTDLVGFSLLVPITRRWIHRRMRSRLERMIEDGSVRIVGMPGGLEDGLGVSFGGGVGSRREDGFQDGPDDGLNDGFDDGSGKGSEGERGLDPDKEISQ